MNKKAKLKFKIAIPITFLIIVLGILAAIFNNPPAQLGYGYIIGINFFVVAVIFYTVCLLINLKRIMKSDLSETLAYKEKRSLIRISELVYCLMILSYFVLLPLKDGFEFSERFIIYLWLYSVKDHVIPAMLAYWGFIALKYKLKNISGKSKKIPKEIRLYHNIGVAVICGICLCVAISITDLISVNIANGMYESSASIVFNDYESFEEFMETEVPNPNGEDAETDEDDPFYDGNRIVLKDTDGNILVDCEEKNGSVYTVHYGEWTDNYLPIRVMTYTDLETNDKKSAVVYRIFDAICIAEAGVAIFVYFKKRMKKSDLLSATENSGEISKTIEKPLE